MIATPFWHRLSDSGHESPDPPRTACRQNASSPLESFQHLLSSVRGIPLADLQKAGRDADTSAYLSSLSPALQVTHLHEISYISHFTWLFAKILYLCAVEPSRLEAMLLHPDDVLNESLCSELLYATRVSFPVKDSSFRKKLEMMQQNQPVFHANLLGEWLFWLRASRTKTRRMAQRTRRSKVHGCRSESSSSTRRNCAGTATRLQHPREPPPQQSSPRMRWRMRRTMLQQPPREAGQQSDKDTLATLDQTSGARTRT